MSSRREKKARTSEFRFRVSTVTRSALMSLVILAASMIPGCAHLSSAAREAVEESLESHIEYMKRAAEADDKTWKAMKAQAGEQGTETPVTERLQLGFLLTSPNAEESSVQTGKKMLEATLREQPDVDPALRNLVELRLREVEAREALQVRIKDVERKIEELMSIESSIEKQKKQTGRPPR